MSESFRLGATLDFQFNTKRNGPKTLSGTPTIDVYEDNSTTQVQTGLTPTVDFDSVTGLNNLRINATAVNGYEAGKTYHAVLAAGTVDGISVVGCLVAKFTIERAAVNVVAISDSSAVADNLEASLETMIAGTASGGTPASVISNITGEGDLTFVGRALIFRNGPLKYEAGIITDYISNTGTFVFGSNTFTQAPTTETFVIV